MCPPPPVCVVEAGVAESSSHLVVCEGLRCVRHRLSAWWRRGWLRVVALARRRRSLAAPRCEIKTHHPVTRTSQPLLEFVALPERYQSGL